MTPINEKQRSKLLLLAAAELGLLVMNGEVELAEHNFGPTPQQNRAKVIGLEAAEIANVYEAALAIAEERALKLTQLRAALLGNETHRALDIARDLCGIGGERREEGNRTYSRVN